MTTKRRKMNHFNEDDDEDDANEKRRLLFASSDSLDENECLTPQDYAVSLLETLNKMRDSELLCDYRIKVNNKTLNCHKFLLMSKSDYFNVMLTGNFYFIVLYWAFFHFFL